MTFTLISQFNTPVAIICDAPPNPGQRSILFGLLPDPANNYPDLATRWEVPTVLSTPDWHSQQLKRAPMLRPTGPRLAFLAMLLLAVSLQPSAFAARLHSPKGREQSIPTAPAIPSLPSVKSLVPSVPFLPSAVVLPPSTNTWFFAATAIDTSFLESDYSNEASLITTNKRPRVTLAWDKSSSTNISSYRVYIGGSTRAYTNTVSAGTNLTLALQLGPPLQTNQVLTVTSQNATNLQWRATLTSPWTLLGATNYTGTNVLRPWWRAMGRSKSTPGKATITITRF